MTPEEIIACIDLTSLNATDTNESIQSLCEKATNHLGHVAAICCYPQFISFAKTLVAKPILIATVVNFPSGNASFSQLEDEVSFALHEGVDEIDLVIPYQQVLEGNLSPSIDMTEGVKALCGNKTLKVIIESGELKDPQLIFRLSSELLDHGTDFIKTSTGKTAIGATEEAASNILKALWQYHQKTGILKGLKVSGGIRKINDAKLYMTLAAEYFGEEYLKPETFRIGASSLLDELLHLQF